MSSRHTLIIALLVICFHGSKSTFASGILSQYSMDAAHLNQWKLPNKLKEVSGLALSRDNRLFAHNDESATIFELDYKHGKIVSEFRLGKIRDDFEGIAVVQDHIYLLSSKGTLYKSPIGDNGVRTHYQRFKTGLHKHCEFEGLTYQVETNSLLLLCKTSYKKKHKHQLLIYSWSLDSLSVIRNNTIRVDDRPILKKLNSKRVQPSGITIDQKTGNLLLVASAQKALIELSANGDLIKAIRLPLPDQHRQPEGIALSGDGKLFIADEGGKHKARLSIYTLKD